MDDAETDQIDKYLLDAEIGRGTMGTVYRATHQYTQRTVALKVLSAEVAASDMAEERFRREVSVSTRVDDDGIVEVYDAGRFEETFYYAMELLEGHELAEVMEDLPLEEALTYVADAAESLAACHDAGIVHRDLKPANLFIPEEGPGTKILDFGVASVRNAARATQDGFTLGTPYYMSPEQARDARAAQPQSDVWSLGVIVYELVTGELPFSGGSAMSVMMSVVDEPPRPMPDTSQIPEELRRITERSLQKDPDDRFDDAREFAAALERVALPDDLPTQSVPPADREVAPTLGSDSDDSLEVAETLGSGPEEDSGPSRPSGTEDSDESEAYRAGVDSGGEAVTEKVDAGEVTGDSSGVRLGGIAAALLLLGGAAAFAVWSSQGGASETGEPRSSGQESTDEEQASAAPSNEAPSASADSGDGTTIAEARERVARSRAAAVAGFSRRLALRSARSEAEEVPETAEPPTASAEESGTGASEKSDEEPGARADGRNGEEESAAGAAPGRDPSEGSESGSPGRSGESAGSDAESAAARAAGDEAEAASDEEVDPVGDESGQERDESDELIEVDSETSESATSDRESELGTSETGGDVPEESGAEEASPPQESTDESGVSDRSEKEGEGSDDESEQSESDEDSDRPGFINF